LRKKRAGLGGTVLSFYGGNSGFVENYKDPSNNAQEKEHLLEPNEVDGTE